MKNKMCVSLAIVISMLFANFSPAFAGEFSDLTVPSYQPANVVRKKVVTYATPTVIDDSLKADVIRVYPEGKLKAVLFSFDDGGSSACSIQDYNLLVPLFKKYNIAAAFNVNKKANETAGGIAVGLDNIDVNGVGTKIPSGNTDGPTYKLLMKNLYSNFEVSNHTLDHMSDLRLNKDDFRYQVGTAKNIFEGIHEREVAGYAKAGGSNPDVPDPVPPAWALEYYKYIGIRYIRNAPLKFPATSSSPATLSYSVPDNFYDWNPTMHVTADVYSTYTSNDILDYFLNILQPNNEMKVLFGWGHGSELGSYDWSTASLTTNAARYASFEQYCKTVSDNSNVLWNPTPIEYADYINALWNTKISKDVNGDIIVTNSSGAVDVWLNVYGKSIVFPAGKIVTVDSAGNVMNSQDTEVVYGNPTGLASYDTADNPSAQVDEIQSAVTVSGTVDKSQAGKYVTLLLIKSTADINNLTNDDMGYLYQSTVDANGQYLFNFKFGGFIYNSLNEVSNYKLYLNLAGVDVTQTVKKAGVKTNLAIKASWVISTDSSIATAFANIDNTVGLKNMNYTMVLAFYSDKNRLLGMSSSNTRAIAIGIIDNKISFQVPAGTKTIKAILVDNLEKIIPLCEPGFKSLN